jgi:sugar diacid utilization regulator
VLDGNPPSPGPRLNAAKDAGLLPGTPYVVIAAPPPVAPEPLHLRSAAIAFSCAVGSPLHPLTVVGHDEVVVVAAVERGVDHLLQTLPAAQETLAREGITMAVGVSTVYDRLDRMDQGYAEAASARERVGAGGGVVALPAASAFDCLALFGAETARRRIPAPIKQFVTEDLRDGGPFTTTLLECVAADFNAKLAAERLFVHPNTARYRIGTIEERTDCDLRCVSDVLDLLIAVRLERATSGES